MTLWSTCRTGLKKKSRSAVRRLMAGFRSIQGGNNPSDAGRDKPPETADLLRYAAWFDADWYLKRYPDVADAGMDPVQHYLEQGAGQGRDPGPEFSTAAYLKRYPDVAENGVNPLLHYILYGSAEGRLITPVDDRDGGGRPYVNLEGYLKYSLLDPLMKAPFVEADKRCFAVMDKIACWLCGHLRKSEQEPLVSVIMPVRDRAGVVGDAVRSVLAQTYRPFELIVIDDGSLDDSRKVICEFSDTRIVLLENDVSQGVSAARNRGLNAAGGELIAYLDSDNTWLPDYLSVMVGAFVQLPDADAAYCGQYLYQAHESLPFAMRFGSFNRSLLQHLNYIDLNCFMHRRAVLDEVGGGFVETMKRFVDWELILRIAEKQRVYSIPVIQSNYYFSRTDNAITDTEDIEPAREALLARSFYGYRNLARSVCPIRRKVTVIVYSYNALDTLKECLASLAQDIGNPRVRIVIVDDASGGAVKEYLRSLPESTASVHLNDDHHGFAHAVNQGVEQADADSDLLILHHDIVPASGVPGILQKIAYADENTAVSVPQQVLDVNNTFLNRKHVPYAEGNVPCDVSLSFYHDNVDHVPLFHNGETVELNFAPFCCVYIKRDIWDSCGGLDAGVDGHYRSERIMCDYIRQILRKKVVYTPEAVVFLDPGPARSTDQAAMGRKATLITIRTT